MLDLAIIGSGPAALTCALYSARAGLSVKVFEKGTIGGALVEIAKIENFPGFLGTGAELAQTLRSQATSAGARITYGTCQKITPASSPSAPLSLTIDDETVSARAVLVATGSEPRPLDFDPKIPVAYCALCDAPLYKNKDIAVIGGGNSAIQESLHLASIVNSLTIFARTTLRAQAHLIKQLTACKNVTIREHTPPTPALLAPFAGVFVFIGHRPATFFLDPALLDSAGFIKTKDYATSVPGLFSAGDVRSGSIKQAITASAEGAASALQIIDFLKDHPLDS